MKSKMGEAIKLQNYPVAILTSDSMPEGALQFKEGVWGCVAAMLSAASKGRTAALCERTTVCRGGKAGLGFFSKIRYLYHYRDNGSDGNFLFWIL